MDLSSLYSSMYKTLLELSCEDGITASSSSEVYGCIFGRDSAITILKILKSLKKNKKNFSTSEHDLLQICKNALQHLVVLQGKEINTESGEQPGKFIHEYRTSNYDRLLVLEKPWYVYPDGIMRNYDSIDATPLGLISLYKYYELTHDNEFLLSVLPHVKAGLDWILQYSDMDGDFLVEYELAADRKYGGLSVQSWTDSDLSLRDTNNTMPLYPVAPVEVQGYIWLALKLWADFYKTVEVRFSDALRSFAKKMKQHFNQSFIIIDNEKYFASQALDGNKNQIKTITGNPLLLLYATYQNGDKKETVLEERYISDFVKRVFEPDLFDPHAGIRTMSTKSQTFNPNKDSYHNGSFWPKLNGMIHEGLENWNFSKEAELLRYATLKPIQYFGSPIELYVRDHETDSYYIYEGSDGQKGCSVQAWSAAVALELASE